MRPRLEQTMQGVDVLIDGVREGLIRLEADQLRGQRVPHVGVLALLGCPGGYIPPQPCHGCIPAGLGIWAALRTVSPAAPPI